jgi:8-oxo-dGTP pyrophosphatase MutT (NUDIX family)
MDKNAYKKVVVVFLHKNFDSYLLQLRDFKSSIIYPGHWGAFGGAMEEGESPETAICRELIEEIGYKPEVFNFFRQSYKDKHKLNVHIFYSNMSISTSELYLMEGADMGMFTKEEILTKNLYSQKLGKAFPIVPLLSEMFDNFFEYVDKNIRLIEI